MHNSGPLPLAFEGPEQGFGGKNSSTMQNVIGPIRISHLYLTF